MLGKGKFIKHAWNEMCIKSLLARSSIKFNFKDCEIFSRFLDNTKQRTLCFLF